MVTKKAYRLMTKCVLVADVVGFINDDKVESGRRIQIKKTLLDFSFSVYRSSE